MPTIQRHTFECKNSALYLLPAEILLHIMMQVDPATLFLLRQTALVFSNLFIDKLFLRYHGSKTPGDVLLPFAITSLTAIEKQEAARILQRDLLCSTCFETRNRHDWLWKLGHLEEKFFAMGVVINILGFFSPLKASMTIKTITANCYVLTGLVMSLFAVTRHLGPRSHGPLLGTILRTGITKQMSVYARIISIAP
jgi:hypothetical protein